MITCSICGSQNDDLAVVCRSCKSFLQSKVDNLNLFETIWQLIESPKSAFKKIVLARHKNYVSVLSALVGISITFAVFWMLHLGNRFDNVLVLTSVGAAAGIPFGLAFILTLSAAVAAAVRWFRGKATLRNSWAVVSYAGVPVVLSLVFVFPLEVAIFGIDFFGTNPPPLVINPGVYLALVAFDGLTVLWSVFLLYRGIMIVSGFGRARTIVVTAVAVVLVGGLFISLKLLAGPAVAAGG